MKYGFDYKPTFVYVTDYSHSTGGQWRICEGILVANDLIIYEFPREGIRIEKIPHFSKRNSAVSYVFVHEWKILYDDLIDSIMWREQASDLSLIKQFWEPSPIKDN